MTTIDEFMAAGPPPPAPAPPPTAEQAAIVDAFSTGDPLVVRAGAGTGKTTTLELLARSTMRRGRYLAFNKSIADEAQRRMPQTCQVSTIHSLAWRHVVRGDEARQARLNGPRVRSGEIAKALRIEPVSLRLPLGRKRLDAWRLAGLVLRAVEVFCQSADDHPGPQHVERLPGCDTASHAELAGHLQPYVEAAWEDLQRPHGALQFRHAHYLKVFALGHPQLGLDYLLFDEAQDASELMMGLCEDQHDTQVVWVGDENQSIYGWAGAVDATQRAGGARLSLTQSWRFGHEIAEAANSVLDVIGTDLCLTGNPGRDSRVGFVAGARTILCRTNARTVVEVIEAVDGGRKPHLVGNGEEVLRFAYGAGDLQQGKKSTHPDLVCFDTWAEVLDYVESDAMGGELKLLVELVKRFGVRGLVRVLQHELVPEPKADVVISTAHRAKGLEWGTVRLASDLTVEPDEETGELPLEELRLLYVAVTRARLGLDVRSVPLTEEGMHALAALGGGTSRE